MGNISQENPHRQKSGIRKYMIEQEEYLDSSFPRILFIEVFFWVGLLMFERFSIDSPFIVFLLIIGGILVPVYLILYRFRHAVFLRNIRLLHAIMLLFWNIVAAVVVYGTSATVLPDPRWQAGSAVYYVIINSVAFCLAFPIRRILPLLTGVPLFFLVLVVISAGNVSFFQLILLFFIGTVWLMCSIVSRIVDRLWRREFRIRLLAERRREKSLEELNRAELLNAKLSETTEILKREIEERKALEKSLEQYAAFDDLTSVYNRRAGLEVLKEALHYAERKQQDLTVVFVDLDRLKTVNDNYGHAAGDSYLRDVVTLMRRHLRKSDSISRYGGDEFLLILAECNETEARNIFSRIEEDVRLMNEGDRLFPISFSYGFAEAVHGEVENHKELISRADSMMYINKQTKRLKQ